MSLSAQRNGMERLPDLITHTFDPARRACQNICTLGKADAENILQDIRASGQRSIKPDYLRRRMLTEDRLIAERQKKAGADSVGAPKLFFLGDFQDGKDPSRLASLVIQLRGPPA